MLPILLELFINTDLSDGETKRELFTSQDSHTIYDSFYFFYVLEHAS